MRIKLYKPIPDQQLVQNGCFDMQHFMTITFQAIVALVAYLDDLTIVAKLRVDNTYIGSIVYHWDDVDDTLDIMISRDIQLQPKKSQIMKLPKEIVHLFGRDIQDHGSRIDQRRLEDFLTAPAPKDRKELVSLLAMLSW
ncbi:hypothetical protein SARC_17146 [Sphaeroforma arctica JP610]|uniref:Uncharacterized protein n=1 Tax=Sphaeroforma arctica JP610 TaxID=667725 RepID=A0A0L0F0T4_9EUKA|nr:hypothetical protein SARC_17146 [Sphaeroforma arctica JP610]KNC70330.1 hypothetical protein SARC_17146 [Sphaeroforma arctica JP610]|eukprot:XP_014144232.1 hypothetical protein SARC_17146 [Sphaeroforma arctica JP610]